MGIAFVNFFQYELVYLDGWMDRWHEGLSFVVTTTDGGELLMKSQIVLFVRWLAGKQANWSVAQSEHFSSIAQHRNVDAAYDADMTFNDR